MEQENLGYEHWRSNLGGCWKTGSPAAAFGGRPEARPGSQMFFEADPRYRQAGGPIGYALPSLPTRILPLPMATNSQAYLVSQFGEAQMDGAYNCPSCPAGYCWLCISTYSSGQAFCSRWT